MTTEFIYPGETLTLTAPSGGVTSNVPVLIGGLLVIPQTTQLEGELFAGTRIGVFNLPKAGADTPAAGDDLYFDEGAGNFTTTATANKLAAICTVAALAADTKVEAVLTGERVV